MMPTIKDQTPKDLFWFNLKILKIVGIWNPYENKSFKKYIYHVYTGFILFIISESIGLLYIDLFQHYDDINIIADSMPFLLTVSTNLIKIIYYLIRHERVTKLLNQLNEGLYPGDSTISNEEELIRKKSFILTVIIVGGALMAGIMAYIHLTINLINFDPFQVPLNDTEPFMHLLLGRQWYPLSWWHKYYILISIHGVSGIILWCPSTDLGFDCLIITIYLQITCQFQVLHRRLFEYQTTNKLIDKERYNLLTKCVIFHQNSLRFVEDLQNLLGPFLFIQFLSSTGVFGIGVYKFAILASPSEKIGMIPYMLNMLLQLWFHCYFGNQLTDMSEKVANFAYLTSWEDFSTKYKIVISMVIFRAQKLVQIYGGKFYILSLETFTNILSASFSYFTLLKEMN